MITSELDLETNSSQKETLAETKRKQNVHCGLTNVTDAAFSFSCDLDNDLRELETHENVNVHGQNIYLYVKQQIHSKANLLKRWIELFVIPKNCEAENDDDDTWEIEQLAIIQSLYEEMVEKYIRMSSSQFRREYLEKARVQKTEAHRKQIRMKSNKEAKKINKETVTLSKKNEPVPFRVSNFSFRLEDQMHTHMQIKQELSQNEGVLESKVVTKKDLKLLCDFYDVPYLERLKKAEIAAKIKTAIQQKDQNVPDGDIDQPSTSTRPARKRKLLWVEAEWPCGVCEGNCEVDSVQCDLCDTWYHYNCLQLDENDDILKKDTWLCEDCI